MVADELSCNAIVLSWWNRHLSRRVCLVTRLIPFSAFIILFSFTPTEKGARGNYLSGINQTVWMLCKQNGWAIKYSPVVLLINTKSKTN